MNTLHVVEYHDQVLELWRSTPMSSRSVLHVDFHCDLRGLLINRRHQRAYRVWDRFPDVDEGNYLMHAVLENRIRRIRWLHDVPGGRQHDLKTVKYESDLTSLPHRCLITLRGDAGLPIDYDVIPWTHWNGLEADEILDLDWDFFASREYPVDSIAQRTESFLRQLGNQRPTQSYICYSPDYSHPSRDQFWSFIRRLATQIRAEIHEVASPAKPFVAPRWQANPVLSPLYRLARGTYRRAGLALRKRGIY